MFKNSLLLIVSLVAGSLIIILGFLWISPRNTQVLKIILPQTAFSLENPPSDSLTGEVTLISGKVGWISRVAATATLISSPIKLRQGESIAIYENGSANINWPAFGNISANSNTQLNFIQTLPENFVIQQTKGTATYNRTGVNPMSIIALDLLIDIKSGENTISINKDLSKITVNVKSGSLSVAFDDIENNTNVVSLKSGDEYIFNDNTRLGLIK